MNVSPLKPRIVATINRGGIQYITVSRQHGPNHQFIQGSMPPSAMLAEYERLYPTPTPNRKKGNRHGRNHHAD